MVFRGDWQPQYVPYDAGDVVKYQGQYYQIIQPHRSQCDWPPSATPALWEVVQDQASFHGCEAENHPPVYHSDEQPRPAPNCDGYQPKQEGGYTLPTGQEVPHEETQKPWYDIRGDTRKEVLAGGGLALGLALAGGALYKHHEHHQKEEGEQRENQAWELQNWVLNAQKQSEEFFRRGPRGPYTWVLSDCFASHQDLVRDAIRGGEEDGQPWFIARAPYHGSLQIGKGRLQRGDEYAFIGYGNKSIQVKKFEVLIGNQNSVEWVEAHGHFNESSLQSQAVEGGYDSDKSKIYIALVEYPKGSGKLHPGKASQSLAGGYCCYGDDEKSRDTYKVLCLKGAGGY